MNNFNTQFMLGLKLIHDSKRGPVRKHGTVFSYYMLLLPIRHIANIKLGMNALHYLKDTALFEISLSFEYVVDKIKYNHDTIYAKANCLWFSYGVNTTDVII